jgi:hypothetical protein
MISRIWHGWTTLENADAYEALLKNEIFPDIQNRQLFGYRGIHLLRRNLSHKVEFITVMWFDSLDALRAYAGVNYERAIIAPKARALLAQFDGRAQHYEVEAEMWAGSEVVKMA